MRSRCGSTTTGQRLAGSASGRTNPRRHVERLNVLDRANESIMTRPDTELYDALREIEKIEDQLHAEDHQLAERLSDARMQLNGKLIADVILDDDADE